MHLHYTDTPAAECCCCGRRFGMKETEVRVTERSKCTLCMWDIGAGLDAPSCWRMLSRSCTVTFMRRNTLRSTVMLWRNSQSCLLMVCSSIGEMTDNAQRDSNKAHDCWSPCLWDPPDSPMIAGFSSIKTLMRARRFSESVCVRPSHLTVWT